MKNYKNFKKTKTPLIFKKKLNERYFMLHYQEEKNKDYKVYYTILIVFLLLSFLVTMLILLNFMIYFLNKDMFDILTEN